MGPVRLMLALTVAVGLAGCATDSIGPVSNGASAGAWSGTTPTAGTAPAVRTAANLGDFAGPWAGHTDGKTEVERAATLLIEPGKDGGFAITWASFEAGEIAGSVEERQRSLTFRPTGQSGVWLAEAPSRDPHAHLAAWARIVGDTLRVDTLALRTDGELERQVYERTLADNGLNLTYRRFVEDELTRTIGARFLRL